MYFVKYGSEWLHDPRVEGVLLSALSFEAEENTCGYCTFHISVNHPLYGELEQRNTSMLVTIYDDKVSMVDPYFQGYIYSIEADMYLTAEVKCKGILAYLGDAILRPYSTLSTESSNTAPNKPFLFFRWLLDQYNSQMNVEKRFVEGKNEANLLDSNEYIYRSNENYSTVAAEIQNKLLDELGGYISIRYEDGNRYVDYVADFDSMNSQVLDFGVNLLDFARTDDAQDIVTCIVPLGASMSDTEYSYSRGYSTTSDAMPVEGKTYATYDSEKDEYSTFSAHYFDSRITYYVKIPTAYEVASITSFADGEDYYTLSPTTGKYTKVRAGAKFDPAQTYYTCTKSYYSKAGISAFEDGVDYYTVSTTTDGAYSKVSNTYFKENITYYEYNKANDESNNSLTIVGLPDGKLNNDIVKSGDMVYSRDGVAKYGFIYGTYENSDLKVRENLLDKGVSALGGLLSPKTTIEVKAVDLSLIDPELKPIRIGDYVRVRSDPHSFDSYMLCRDIDLDLVNPENSTYTLGFTYDTLTGQSNSRINALNATINHVYQTADAISQEAKDAAQAAGAATEKATEASNKAETALENIANLRGKFLYVRYSANADGGNFTDAPTADTKYMGIYSGDSETAPENASDYVWSLIKGTDGVGVKGDDGEPAFLHIKYSDDGTTFTSNSGETAGAWIGTYSDHTEADSTKFSDYTWTKIKGDRGEQGLRGLQGERGEQGIAGAAGSDGQPSYFHIKYAPVASPTKAQMTETPDVYIGTYVDNTAADSTEPSAYMWARFQGLQGEKGEQGIAGVGTDGRTSYLHIKYSDDGGKTFTAENGEVAGDYIGTCTDFTQNDPTSVTAYKWARIKGDNGSVTYTETPTPPYFVGDMWTVQASGDRLDEGTLPFRLETRAAIYVCIKDSEGEFNISDWSIASTDDSAAQDATNKALEALGKTVVKVETQYSTDGGVTWTNIQPSGGTA